VGVLFNRNQPLHQLRIIFLLDAVDFLVVRVHLGRIIHRAEFWATHGAEGCLFVVLVGQGFVVHGAGSFGIEGELELLLPIELIAGVAEGVIAIAGAGASAGDVGGMGGNLVGDDAVFYVFLVR